MTLGDNPCSASAPAQDRRRKWLAHRLVARWIGALFFSALHGPWAVEAVNRTTGSRHTVYGNPSYDVTSFRVSPDGASAVSPVFDNGESYIRVAHLRNDGTVLPEDWIRIASDAADNDRPMWSATGNLIYYTSSRDGFRCIWAQRLDPVSKRAAGAPEAVYHSHSAGLSLRNSGQNRFKIAVAPDRLVFNMGELRGKPLDGDNSRASVINVLPQPANGSCTCSLCSKSIGPPQNLSTRGRASRKKPVDRNLSCEPPPLIQGAA